MSSDVCIIIPVWNEGAIIQQTLKKVLKTFPVVVCVNDGSRDDSAKNIQKTSAFLVNHPLNMGQGAALQTGVEFALQFEGIKYFVTFDADGQHDIKDVKKMIDILMKRKLDIILGSRFLGSTLNMSRAKRTLLIAAIKFTNIFSGVALTDTHNGLRVFNRAFAEQLNITMPGFAHASEIIDKIGKGNWKYEEAPVTIHYTDYSRSKGQSILNSVNIVAELLLSRHSK